MNNMYVQITENDLHNSLIFNVDQPGLEICCANSTTHRQSVCCQRSWCKR